MKTNIKPSIITTNACGAFALAAVAQNQGTGTTGAGSQGNLEALFKALDTNADGSISRDSSRAVVPPR